jgi:hypothetical protein
VANGWLDTLRGGSNFTAFATPFVKLHTGDPGSAGTANAAAGSTTRVAVTQSAASGGSITISGTNPVWTNGGTSETLTHVSIWSASTSGTFMYSVALTASQAWVSTNTFTLTSLTVSLSPLAA